MTKWFENDAHRIRTVKGKHNIAIMFDVEGATRIVDMLNELTIYKMIIRDNKQIIEDINQKTINELKKEYSEEP